MPPSPASGSSDNRDEPLRSRDSQHPGSRESSSQRKESLTAGGSRRGSRRGSRESLSGRRESERRAVASDEGSTVGRERSSSSLRRGSPREDSHRRGSPREDSHRRGSPREEPPRRGSPREETLRRGSPRDEPLPPVPSSGRVSRSIENVLSR